MTAADTIQRAAVATNYRRMAVALEKQAIAERSHGYVLHAAKTEHAAKIGKRGPWTPR